MAAESGVSYLLDASIHTYICVFFSAFILKIILHNVSCCLTQIYDEGLIMIEVAGVPL